MHIFQFPRKIHRQSLARSHSIRLFSLQLETIWQLAKRKRDQQKRIGNAKEYNHVVCNISLSFSN